MSSDGALDDVDPTVRAQYEELAKHLGQTYDGFYDENAAIDDAYRGRGVSHYISQAKDGIRDVGDPQKIPVDVQTMAKLVERLLALEEEVSKHSHQLAELISKRE